MGPTPLELRKAKFPQRFRGLDPQAVHELLEVVAEELSQRLADKARLEEDLTETRRRLEAAHGRQQELQEAVVHARRISKEMQVSAQREADLLIREAQVTAEKIVGQAIEQAGRIEARLADLRARRRELQLRLGHTLDRFRSFLDEDVEDHRETATVRTLPRRQPGTTVG